MLSPDATEGDSLALLDKQTDRLEKANGRGDDILAIMDNCEKVQEAVLKALNPGHWWDHIGKK